MGRKMSENVEQRKFSWLKFFMYSFLVGGLAAVVAMIFKVYFCFFALDENTMAKFAFAWKKNCGMDTFKKWKKMSKNSWDDKNTELDDFIKVAQGDAADDKYLTELNPKHMLYDFFPEHFPRENLTNYYSYNFEWNEKIFLPFRKFVVQKSIEKNEKVKTQLKEVFEKQEEAKEKKKDEKPKDLELYVDLPKIVMKDEVYPDDLKNVKTEIHTTLGSLHTLL